MCIAYPNKVRSSSEKEHDNLYNKKNFFNLIFNTFIYLFIVGDRVSHCHPG